MSRLSNAQIPSASLEPLNSPRVQSNPFTGNTMVNGRNVGANPEIVKAAIENPGRRVQVNPQTGSTFVEGNFVGGGSAPGGINGYRANPEARKKMMDIEFRMFEKWASSPGRTQEEIQQASQEIGQKWGVAYNLPSFLGIQEAEIEDPTVLLAKKREEDPEFGQFWEKNPESPSGIEFNSQAANAKMRLDDQRAKQQRELMKEKDSRLEELKEIYKDMYIPGGPPDPNSKTFADDRQAFKEAQADFLRRQNKFRRRVNLSMAQLYGDVMTPDELKRLMGSRIDAPDNDPSEEPGGLQSSTPGAVPSDLSRGGVSSPSMVSQEGVLAHVPESGPPSPQQALQPIPMGTDPRELARQRNIQFVPNEQVLERMLQEGQLQRGDQVVTPFAVGTL